MGSHPPYIYICSCCSSLFISSSFPSIKLQLFVSRPQTVRPPPITNKQQQKNKTQTTIMASNPLSPQRILQAMADALPTHKEGDSTSDLSSSAEAVALFAHACMTNVGFRLLGFNEDQKIGNASLSLLLLLLPTVLMCPPPPHRIRV